MEQLEPIETVTLQGAETTSIGERIGEFIAFVFLLLQLILLLWNDEEIEKQAKIKAESRIDLAKIALMAIEVMAILCFVIGMVISVFMLFN